MDLNLGDESSLRGRFARVRSMIDAGHLHEAEQELAVLQARWPEHAVSWAFRGVLCDRQGRIDEALEAMAYAARLRPDDGEILANLARLYARGSRWEEALQYCRRSLIIDENQPHVWLEAARCCLVLRQWREAEACARNSLHLQGRQAQAFVFLGQALAAQQRCVEAQGVFEAALAEDEQNAEAWDGAAWLELRRGDLKSAIVQYRRALELRLGQPLRVDVRTPPVQGFDDTGLIEALLWQTLARLAQAGVHAFATSGTLLGLTRERRLLPFDKDLDIGLPFAEMDSARACLLVCGWQEEPSGADFCNPMSFRHQDSGVVLDLFGFLADPVAGTVVSGFWLRGQPWSVQRVTEYPAPLRLHQVRRSGGRVWALIDPEIWLAALYGAEWRVPDPDFDSVVAARNLRGFSLLTECYGLMRIGKYLHERRYAKGLATTIHCLRHLPEDALLQRAEAVLMGAVEANSASA
ncbi:tetratricopeptide repeat protein [Thiorhodococcus fuscus]|uniref:Tetratricopeptide repeat protein n=1 Tax=Thiorhodococcus fuscus TaxID=527200 RepID=A0ABW4YAJ8_9GAMM